MGEGEDGRAAYPSTARQFSGWKLRSHVARGHRLSSGNDYFPLLLFLADGVEQTARAAPGSVFIVAENDVVG